MKTFDKFKFFLLKTPLAKFFRGIEFAIVSIKLSHKRPLRLIPNTLICISPYKTGTTFLSSTFGSEVSKHEPLHYTTYKILDKDFNKYFPKRLRYLNLKFECSGYWSAYVDDLATNEIAKKLNYLCVLRPPSSWITSVINYWNRPNMSALNFCVSYDLFWKDKIGVDLRQFDFENDTEKNEIIINKLIKFYFDFTKKTSSLNNITYIRLEEIDKSIPLIEKIINEKADKKDQWKRENIKKAFIYRNEFIDQEYTLLTNKLIKKRKYTTKAELKNHFVLAS